MHYSNTCTEARLHAHCEDIIAPGTLGHIAQKTLHLAATNSTTGQHHNTNSFHTQTFRSRIPTKNMPKNPGRVILASRRPSRQSPKRAQLLPIPHVPNPKIWKIRSAFGRNLEKKSCCCCWNSQGGPGNTRDELEILKNPQNFSAPSAPQNLKLAAAAEKFSRWAG